MIVFKLISISHAKDPQEYHRTRGKHSFNPRKKNRDLRNKGGKRKQHINSPNSDL